MSPPTVYRQAWVMIRPDGSYFFMGHSYHLKEADLHAFVSDYLDTASPIDDLGGHEEPTGDPVSVQVSESFFRQVTATAHGLRAR